MNRLSYDLHIHSCLSPCGDDDMTPANIVGMAVIKELDVIAVTDHNSCKNCEAVCKWANEYGIIALPGMELTTEEEVHVLCLFATLEEAMRFDRYVDSKRNRVKNREDIFGKQLICNCKDEVIQKEEDLLLQNTTIRFERVYELMQFFHGVMIPAHIEKNSNSLLYNLGFIPIDSKFRCVEIKNMERKRELLAKHPYLEECVVVSNSDAHTLTDIHEPLYKMEVRERSPEAVMEWLRNDGRR